MYSKKKKKVQEKISENFVRKDEKGKRKWKYWKASQEVT